jgi:hypothetical protein
MCGGLLPIVQEPQAVAAPPPEMRALLDWLRQKR